MSIARGFRAVSLATVCLLSLAPLNAVAGVVNISTTFDSDLEGFDATGVDFTTSGLNVTSIFLVPKTGDMVHTAIGGNPDGYARLPDGIESPSSFAQAPSSYTASLFDAIGGTLTFDHRVFNRGLNDSGQPASLAPYVVLISTGNLLDLNALVWTAPAPAGNTDWESFEINLTEGGPNGLQFVEDVNVQLLFPDFPLSGTVGSLLQNSASMPFEQILMGADTLLLPFELANNEGNQNSESAGLDNVRLIAQIPEPSALAMVLLAIGALLLVRRRQPQA